MDETYNDESKRGKLKYQPGVWSTYFQEHKLLVFIIIILIIAAIWYFCIRKKEVAVDDFRGSLAPRVQVTHVKGGF